MSGFIAPIRAPQVPLFIVGIVIARSDSSEAIQFFNVGTGLLRSARSDAETWLALGHYRFKAFKTAAESATQPKMPPWALIIFRPMSWNSGK
jgi:hypothetical protein